MRYGSLVLIILGTVAACTKQDAALLAPAGQGVGNSESANRAIVGPGSSVNQIQREFENIGDDLRRIGNKSEDIRSICDGLDDTIDAFNDEVGRRSGGNLVELTEQLDSVNLDINQTNSAIEKLDFTRGKLLGKIYAVARIRTAIVAYGVHNGVHMPHVQNSFKEVKKGKKYLHKSLRIAVRARESQVTGSLAWWNQEDRVRKAQTDLYTTKEELTILRWYLNDPRAQTLNPRMDDEIMSRQQELVEVDAQLNSLVTLRNARLGEFHSLLQKIDGLYRVGGVRPLFLPEICGSGK